VGSPNFLEAIGAIAEATLSERAETTAPPAGVLSEQEIQVRLATVNVGIGLTLIVSLGGLIYALFTWDQPHRTLITAIIVVGLLSALVVRQLPIEQIVRGPFREFFFVGWSSADIALIAALAALDGGTRSPYILLLVLPFLFGTLSYPLRATILIGVLDVGAFLGIALIVGGGLIYSGFGIFALLCIALLASWESGNQARRRAELAETAEALQQSEETSRLQARQQIEVARFGQLALAGAGIDELHQQATELVNRVLGTQICGVLKAEPGESEFVIVAAVGLPEGAIGKARVPAGTESQAGYVLATGTPLIVRDWQNETRFKQSQPLKEAGMLSGVTVLIKGKGEPIGVLGAHTGNLRDFTAQDVSFMEAIANVLANAVERRTAEAQTQHEALHDPLTGLPNRTLFLDRLEHALAQAARHGASVSVLFLDLDQFKLVNDSLGHAAGDELLATVAPRIEQALRPGDTVARFGGDEFAILVEDIANERGATRVAERIAEALTRPFILRQREHFVSASIGIAIGTGSEVPEALIRDADAALYRAKERGRGGYEIFDEVMRSRVIEHMQTENDLRRALQRRELELYYQPIIRLRDGNFVAIEALLRWNHPERGLIGPMSFIPVAEESRLIIPIGRWVIEQACRQAVSWQSLDPDGPPIGVSVNLSARQVADPDLVSHIQRAIEDTGIDPSTLRLELTESTLLDDTSSVENTLQDLRELGTRLVLDDFGTGFSSLGYLKRLPLSAIKLDRSFVEHVAEDAHDAAIVHAVAEMAETMGIDVVAEGVETEEQMEAAARLGCGYAQGFYFTEPIPATELENLLAQPLHTSN
jgi:diguanylate cyclase (GGDEF)-like protein